MKKTLITLMALAGVAVAEDWTATFSSSDQTYHQDHNDYSAEFEVNAPLTLQFDNLTFGSTGTYNGSYTAGAVNPSAIRPNANICKEGAAGTYTLTFTLTNESENTLTIDAITLNVFGYNSSGNAHSEGTPEAYFDLTYELPNSSESITMQQNANVFSTGTVTYAMQEGKSIDLVAGDSITMALNVTRKSGGGGFVGLSGATITGQLVPEPTTATLSLLALAGLATRRRRK